MFVSFFFSFLQEIAFGVANARIYDFFFLHLKYSLPDHIVPFCGSRPLFSPRNALSISSPP